ncbi:MAG: DUF881 domain-containing protein [Bacteroidota bacterium]
MLNKKEWQWPVAFVCLCLGFLLAVQLQTQSALQRPTLPTRRLEAALEMLQQIERERDALAEENKSLRTAVAGRAANRASLRELQAEMQRTLVLAGLTPVSGPGVVITIDDSSRPARPGEDPEFFLIHDEDLLRTVNELRAAGAEAIAINGQRIVGSTAIRCVGPNILINTHQVAPPYVIEAIGEQNDLMQTNMRGGVLDFLRSFGYKAEIVAKDQIDIPAYTGSLGGNFATPKPGGEG